MSNTQHTPGPWKLHEDGFIYKMDNGNAFAIADPHCTKELDISEREANAELIANAPETAAERDRLKEALRKLWAFTLEGMQDNDEPDPLYDALMNEVEAALNGDTKQ